MRKLLLLLFISLFTAVVAFAQNGVVTGKLLDAQTKEPLIGATVLVKGTTVAAAAGLDGTFKIAAPAGSTLMFSYIGYVPKEITATGKDLGTILLDPTSASMKEVTVNENASLAIDRQTPIAVSSVGAKYIEEKGAGAELPELLKSTPSITISRAGGGYGDSRIAIRGFNSNNLALLINGLPVQDPEAGKIFWNDWAGLADVTTSFQVQRGLSASRVAVPSMGGTINITTKNTDSQEGGTISQQVGSYNSLKTAVSYSTGITPSGWATSFLLSKSSGDGTGEGLYYTGYSYFANISKIIGTNQTLSINFMGASQNHGQRFTYNTIAIYRAAPQGETRYNSDYGYYNGKLFSGEINFYNKPLLSVSHDWRINSTSSLSTVLYASYGTGAAEFVAGSQAGFAPGGSAPRLSDPYSPIDFNAIAKNNMSFPDGNARTYQEATFNNHKQYGLISTFKKTVGDVNFLAGVDLRTYTGNHFYKLENLFGAGYYLDNTDVNNPNRHTVVGDMINNNYQYGIVSEGAFAQAEYVKNDVSAFLTVGANNTGNRKIDYFDYLSSNAAGKSAWINFLGYQVKGGANYNIDSQNNVFANAGFVEKPPLIGTVFPNAKTTGINDSKTLEKLLNYEIGYGFKSSAFSANVSLYHATYKDRAKTITGPVNQDGSISYGNINGINEVHQGVEFDAKFRPVRAVTISAMFSYGDYHYISDSGTGLISSDNPATKATTIASLPINGLKIGDFGGTAASNAQTTAGFGLDVDVLPTVRIGGNFNYYARFIASYDMTKLNNTNGGNFDPTVGPYSPVVLPNYSITDLDIVYRFKLAGLDASFIGNVNNLFNATYLSEAIDASPTNAPGTTNTGRLSTLGVNYGAGRIYMTTLKVKF